MSFRRILVAADTVQGIDMALDRARVIEHVTEAEVLVAQVIWDVLSEQPDSAIGPTAKATIIRRFIDTERRLLGDAIAPYLDKIETLDTRVFWAKHIDQRIAAEVASRQIDLVIKPVTVAGRGLHDWFLTPVDWRLMRAVSVPVLFAQAPMWGRRRCVLAALDVAPEHAQINRRIIACARNFADVLGCAIHFVHATESGNADLRRQLVRIVDDESNCHVLEGKPADAIRQYADDIGASVTIVGTAARQGVGKLFVGNTAEQIIGATNRDLVTVQAP